ncbi:transposase [Paenibacillus thiaminolyticus]|uniref:Transposase n=2 Tax=Paenibacillus thiaminolyticus TaxID=49283 RepID=A0AAP9E0S8_PANTH|nr:transposase [Paenibacillus thiaminolyticus]MCY9534036.1 transposase [Paenibacillus thiaminolyticus]MCY9610346.1 transposase [Paenibacillus thiaminolyticus]MCY9653818.1 transposase [Paenibacillus thiaminolyticus]MCY9740785.1 transposase [Paenibacillus thiaminolyticus]QDM47389.1 IS1595 family transposase [Paenibacillus thiaminolyticus]
MSSWESIHSVEELLQLLHNEAEINSFLFHMKWPSGFVCPRCHHGEAYVIKTRRLPLYDCRACRHQTSLIAGTIMEGSRTALWKWLTAIWLVSRTDLSFNAVQLRSLIQVTYKTAWSMLHKIRTAISRADTAQPLEGAVHGIVAFYGRPFYSPILLHERESPIIVAESGIAESANSDSTNSDSANSLSVIEMNEQVTHTRRIKMKIVDRMHCSGKSLLRTGCDEFAKLHAHCDSTVSITRYYFHVRRKGFLYQTFKRAWQWMNNTFHGIGSTYLQLYLDEFCFRHNAAADGTASRSNLLRSCLSFRNARGSNTSYVIPAA